MATLAEEKRDYIKANLPKAGLVKHCGVAGCRLNQTGRCLIHRDGGCPQSRHAKEYAMLKSNKFYRQLVNAEHEAAEE